MNKYEEINRIIKKIEDLKDQDLTRSELNMINLFLKPIYVLRNHWTFDEKIEKQAREFYRDIRDTVHGDNTGDVCAMTLHEVAVVMNISIVTATKFVHYCVNRGWISVGRDNNYLI